MQHTAVLGTTEKWRLRNTSPITHYVHIHQELWRTVSRDGKRPPPWERGFEDTWRVDPGETVEVAARFTDYTGTFMVHCHMLDHEDHGMMAQFRVVRPGSSGRAAWRLRAGPRATTTESGPTPRRPRGWSPGGAAVRRSLSLRRPP